MYGIEVWGEHLQDQFELYSLDPENGHESYNL